MATLSLLGYDPERYYTGRAPLEAAAMGFTLGPDDWAIRCNLMTIQDGRLADFTAGHITSEEGAAIMETIAAKLGRPNVEFHAGVSYRNLMIYRGKPGEVRFNDQTTTDPPHDHPGQPAAEHLPRGAGADLLIELMNEAAPILADHPVNQARVASGKSPASAIWLWGQGKAPTVTPFRQQYGLNGAIISAVDLVRGVGQLAGWTRIDVPARPATSTPTTPPRLGTRSTRSPSMTSSAFTSRLPTRPATKEGPTRRSRRSSASITTSSRRFSTI